MMGFSDLILFNIQFFPIIAVLFSLHVVGQNESNNKKNQFKVIYILFGVVVGLVAVLLLFIFFFKKARKPDTQLQKQQLKQKQQEDSLQQVLDDEKSLDDADPLEENDIEYGKYVINTNNNIKGQKNVISGSEENNSRKLLFIEESASRLFQLHDLLKAPAEGLGRGTFGNSYKAMLEGGRSAVVVKRLRDLKPLSNEEFTKQLLIIGSYRHPNLLPPLAYYCSREEKLLVYKYAENGNLFTRLHGGRKSSSSSSTSTSRNNRDRIPFRWSSRLSVARSVVRALEYLQTNKSVILPHGNLKSSNILLDENEMVLVADYGFSSLVATPIASQRMVSYKSPEYQSHKKISGKSDVWSYGCLLLELLTGRMSVYSAPPGIHGVDLSSWVLRAVREEWTGEIFDPEISVQRSAASGMLKLLQIAIQCCNKSPEKRPDMMEIVQEVESIKPIESSDEEEVSFDHSSLTYESRSISVSVASVASASASPSSPSLSQISEERRSH